MAVQRSGGAGGRQRRYSGDLGLRAATAAVKASSNRLPSPGTPLLEAVNVPPISSVSRRLMANPRPVPP